MKGEGFRDSGDEHVDREDSGGSGENGGSGETKFVYAPFTPEQVWHLNEYQVGPMHPFTCGNDDCPGVTHEVVITEDMVTEATRAAFPEEDFQAGVTQRVHASTSLVATPDGWVCPTCGYEQYWALEGMSDGTLNEGYKKFLAGLFWEKPGG